MTHDPAVLPDDLPVPDDDGAARHLAGTALPDVALPATDGGQVRLAALGPGRTVLYVYPMTTVPGAPPPDGWDLIPGARGCTAEACAFRDHHRDLVAAGAARVFGLSSQDPADQREAAGRLHLPFPLVSDAGLRLADDPGLPTFEAAGMRLFKRLTLVVRDERVEHVFYPVFPPDTHAEQVLAWLRANP
ncbi:peroxiredoxin [Yinghuangia seranimata]|uniref:peroxiredoxin n=1 Tax=Yinghuangia seranimata TaxID=408067 RepID=UPI00248CAD11|nr:peroxiredoxin [Yinghuangia seranimata]MDI2127567.1 peroxiredoxin [Yinghuangia seranimata]